ncbi:HDOD domain-containing protein [Thalassotalea sp. PLHSN55]|uniref:HDOD domain-containing protein n=1 Tax=Thalassotalea sp. PLHSN55 TaxID=3435888 RepID=UPI003F84B975
MLHINDTVVKDIGKGFSIPAQPDLLMKLQQLMAEPEPDMNLIAHTISQDVAVSATILKTINSPLYGLARTIADIQKSVRYIGLQGITTLVTSSLIRKSFTQNNCSIALEEFWQNATNIANTAVFIGKSLGQKKSAEKLFTLGLFHDCGIPVMAMRYEDYQETLDHAVNTPSEPLPEIEESVYQVNHATIGYYVASSWRLPKEICELILSHHDRHYLEKLNGSQSQTDYAILKLAENITHLHKHFRDSADWAYVQDSVLTVLNIDEEDVQDFIEDLSEQLN